MIYEKDKILRLIELKDKIINEQTKSDLEWIISTYNQYYIKSKDYDYQIKNYKNISIKYYNLEDEKEILKEQLELLKRKYKVLKEQYKTSCKNNKQMI